MTEWLKLSTELSAGPYEVGKPFRLTITAEHPAGRIALLPESLSLGDALAERTVARHHTRTGDDKVEVDRYDLELLAFDSGDHTVPSIEMAFGSTTAATNPVTIQVASGLAAEEQVVASSTIPQAIAELEKMVAPNPPPREVLVEDHTMLWIGGGVVAAIVAALVGRVIYKQVRRATRPLYGVAPPPPRRPPHEVALERLEALRKSSYLADSDAKLYYVELSEILRAYVGARFDFDSVELTVVELTAALRGMRTPGLDLSNLQRVLDEADLVKFAKYKPDDTQAHSALNASFEIVERTAPAEEVLDATG